MLLSYVSRGYWIGFLQAAYLHFVDPEIVGLISSAAVAGILLGYCAFREEQSRVQANNIK